MTIPDRGLSNRSARSVGENADFLETGGGAGGAVCVGVVVGTGVALGIAVGVRVALGITVAVDVPVATGVTVVAVAVAIGVAVATCGVVVARAERDTGIGVEVQDTANNKTIETMKAAYFILTFVRGHARPRKSRELCHPVRRFPGARGQGTTSTG